MENHMLPRSHEPNHSSTDEANHKNLDRGGVPEAQTKPPSYSPPPYAQSHDPSLLRFPDVPVTELPPIQANAAGDENGRQLPSLSSVTGSQSQIYPPPQSLASQQSPQAPATSTLWRSLNPIATFYPSHPQAAEPPARMDLDVSSNSAVSAASPDRLYDGRSSSVSLDDPDVRLAAEALGDLRADFLNSPPYRHTSLPAGSSPSQSSLSSKTLARPQTPQEEPLFSLLMSHPLVGAAVGGATSAYNSSKDYSPRFKSGAEYVEGYLAPVASTLAPVARVTGVEGSIRWVLKTGRRPQAASDVEHGATGPNKRRKVDNGDGPLNDNPFAAIPGFLPGAMANDTDGYKIERRSSMASTVDTLPAYDDVRSPAYTENADGQRPNPATAAWQSRLIMSTSGLSVAMSEANLRSLKYCLSWLKWANEHMGRAIGALKLTLEQYDKVSEREALEFDGLAGRGSESHGAVKEEDASQSATAETPQPDRRELAARVMSIKNDVLKTLKDVVDTVSKYTGGALPDNASALVRRHLTSLPQRFRIANMREDSSRQGSQGDIGEEPREKDVKEGAQRVLVLAMEGLDMMAQVSSVLDGTIVSAEEWCERLGKKPRDEKEEMLPQTEPPPSDVKMG